jgi:hypothetical protein
MKRKSTLLILIIVVGLIGFAGCSKKHKSSRDGAITPTGTSTGTATGPGNGGGTVNRPPESGFAVCNLFDEINAARSNPVSWDESMGAVAQQYASWLAQNQMQYSQTADGKSPAIRLQEGGVVFSVCDETGTSDPASRPDWGNAITFLDQNKLGDSRFSRIGIACDAWGASG